MQNKKNAFFTIAKLSPEKFSFNYTPSGERKGGVDNDHNKWL
ncbi:MAG: hypothetical protein WC606_04685 [Candidatus Absconditabacterales bacterium]